MGGVVEDILDVGGDIVEGAGDLVSGAVDWAGNTIGNTLDYITENPLQSIALGLTGYGLYDLLGTAAAAGATEAGLLSADAAQLASQGLSEAQIAETLGLAGADSLAAADAAQLAAQGLSQSQIEAILGQQTLAPVSGYSSPTLSVQQALQGARLLGGLTGQQPTGLPSGMYGQNATPHGAVNYAGTLGLLNQKSIDTGLLGTQFNPGTVDLSQLYANQQFKNLLG